MKIKKRTLKIIGIIFLLLTLTFGFYIYKKNQNKNIYRFEGDVFSYSQNRGAPEYTINLISHNESFDLYKINFKSRNFMDYEMRIYGLLLMPQGKKNVPGLVLLPGGGVSKEAELQTAAKISELGYAVLTFDQRGIGETGGAYLGIEQDYNIFAKGFEPINHLSVYDALRAFDVLREIKNIDDSNIAIAGESMGGRYAIIAAALDIRIKGLIGISTAGFGFVKDDSLPYSTFLLSIDPDHYIGRISPRKVVMLHGTNDSVVSIDNAKRTFDLAKEPKEFFIAEGCGHGYCEKMYNNLRNSLTEIFGK